MMVDVLVIGGGNAALCAALVAREAGASVLLLGAAPRAWRGGNSSHTRNLRCMHDVPQDVLTEAYPEVEFWQDLLMVTGGKTNEALARRAIRESAQVRGWVHRHGVHFQPLLSGALHLSRTNAFFMGGGKALVNAYYHSAKGLGVQVRYDAAVDRLEFSDRRFVAAFVGGERIEARACVVAAGGFESNREWLRAAWGCNARGEWPADNFAIRGTRFNQGVLLKHLIAAGADPFGDPTQAHMVAIDARAPLYDGGIATRVDCASLALFLLLALMVNGTLWHVPLAGNFYAIFPHNTLVLTFGVVFGLALLALAIGVVRFWREVVPGDVARPMRDAAAETTADVLRLKYLDGGHGEGCNEEDDAFTLWRRRVHHFTFHGLLCCFAATTVATTYHCLLGQPAPYALTSLPVMLGVAGGIGLLIGPACLLWLNLRRDPNHGDMARRPMDRGFIASLMLVSSSGLALMIGRDSATMALLLAVHLGSVMALFLTLPYGKFAHGIYRSAALLKWAIEKRKPNPLQLGDE